MRRPPRRSTIEAQRGAGSMTEWRRSAPTGGGEGDDAAPVIASNVLPLPTAAVLYEAAYDAAALPLLIRPEAANAALLANRPLCAVSGYGPEDLALLRLEDVIEPPADSAEPEDASPGRLRCRDGSTIEVDLRRSEIVAAGRRVGTLYELSPPSLAAADGDDGVAFEGGASLETAGVVHDLNNLLTVLSGHVELLCDEFADGDELEDDRGPVERLQLMRHATEGAATLARRLLEIARGVEPEHGLIEPAGLAADAIALVRAGPAAAGEIMLVAEPGLPAISGDRLQLERVLLNLLRNAADAVAAAHPASGHRASGHAAAGPGAPPIEVEVASAGRDHVAFIVRDHGAGIAAAARSRVFEPHFTTKAAGSGLGLATARTLVGAHGGRIEVESSPEGATFTVVLPAATATVTAPAGHVGRGAAG